jgi:hypothetical protein
MPEVHESDWILICGHVGELPIQLYTEEPEFAEELRDKGVSMPDYLPPKTPIHWIALCKRCGVMTAASTIKLEFAVAPQLVRLKDLRDDGAYFQGYRS